MRRTYKYRIYPTKSQQTTLSSQLEQCRLTHNLFIEQRRDAWENHQEYISKEDQINQLPMMKINNRLLLDVHSQVLQEIAVRINKSYKQFYQRNKEYKQSLTAEHPLPKPGLPRFKGYGRYNSMTYAQLGFKIADDQKSVKLSKIGSVKIVLHRPIIGRIKTCTLKRSPTNKWYITFSCDDVPIKEYPNTTEEVGIDVGLTTFATFSDGNKIENPRFFRKEEKELARSQRKKQPKVTTRIHERIQWKRENFAHQQSKKIVDKYHIIAVEDIQPSQMVNNRRLAKSIHDAAWSQFLMFIANKAECAGRLFVRVDPAYTTQECSTCGYRQKLELNIRVYYCPECGMYMGRDFNAACNILRLGQQSLYESTRSSYL